jgi:D,D-heptose 1,7-bisphosphate phosphatase
MANRAVFIDRDGTIMEDPGYVDDVRAVRLLPGVELAIKALSQGGYKTVVVTNQSGVARGLLTEKTLHKIHRKLRRLLSNKGAHLDAIYYCPYHPEGSVEGYAIESDLRKPNPGMLKKAAKELNINLAESWMIGDGEWDMEAGRRANCRTIHIRPESPDDQQTDEDVRADFHARNLVDATRVILHEDDRAFAQAAPQQKGKPGRPATTHPRRGQADTEPETSAMNDNEVRREILRHVRQFVLRGHEEEFSFAKLIGSIVQVLALLGLVIGFVKMIGDKIEQAGLWMLIALVLQVMALTAFTTQRKK